MNEQTRNFLDLPVHHLDVGDGALAYREHGEGDPLLLVHGWPLWGVTWRDMLPALAAEHRCIIVDLLGAGESRWSETTDVGMRAQARALEQLLVALDIERAAVIAHDTGATVARQLALIAPSRVGSIVMMGTEIPNHRPPLVELVQRLCHVPGSSWVFGRLLRSRAYVRSPLGFGGCFADRSLLDGEFGEQIIAPLAHEARRREGQLQYVRAIDWDLVDSLAEGHRRIEQPTLLLWGARDPFFPVHRAREMVAQLPSCHGLETFDGRLFIQEERADAVAARALRFFSEATRAVGASGERGRVVEVDADGQAQLAEIAGESSARAVACEHRARGRSRSTIPS